jgi:hypothetical protein
MLSTKYAFDVSEQDRTVILTISNPQGDTKVFSITGKTTSEALLKHAHTLTDGQIDQWFKEKRK